MRTLWFASFVGMQACSFLEVRRLEAKQGAVETELAQLHEQASALDQQMVGLGLLPKPAQRAEPRNAGKVKGRAQLNDHQTPTEAVGEAMPVSWARTGTPSPLPELPERERVPETACGFKYKIESLKPISDYVLNRADLGKASPVVLFEDDQPLAAHAYPRDFQDRCAGAYRHAGFVILFSPTGAGPESVETHRYHIEHAPDLPLKRGDDGREMFWVYPGTTLTFSFSRGWDPEWGPLWVDLSGKSSGPTDAPLVIRFAGEEHRFFKDNVFLSTQPEPPTEPWTLEIESPAEGPYFLLDLLTLGNPKHGAVVTGPRAFKGDTP